MQATLNSLTEAESEIARSAEPSALAHLDEDGLLEPPRKSTGRRKRDASDVAIGRRNQARRDNR